MVRTLVENYGTFVLIVLLVIKFALGVAVALDKNEFKMYYIGNIFRNDALKLLVFFLLLRVGQFHMGTAPNSEGITVFFGVVLGLHFAAGIVKNVAHLSPTFANRIPSMFREPARLRLGNPKNLP